MSARAPQEPRLRDQCRKLMAFYVQYPGWWTLEELVRGIGVTSEAGVSARLRELTGEPHFWVKAKRKRRGNLWEYRMSPPKSAPPQLELMP